MLWEHCGETKPLALGGDEDNGPIVFPGIPGIVRREAFVLYKRRA